GKSLRGCLDHLPVGYASLDDREERMRLRADAALPRVTLGIAHGELGGEPAPLVVELARGDGDRAFLVVRAARAGVFRGEVIADELPAKAVAARVGLVGEAAQVAGDRSRTLPE